MYADHDRKICDEEDFIPNHSADLKGIQTTKPIHHSGKMRSKSEVKSMTTRSWGNILLTTVL